MCDSVMHQVEKRCMAVLDFKHYGGTLRAVAARHNVSAATLWRWINGFTPTQRRRKAVSKIHNILAPVIQSTVGSSHFTADTILQVTKELHPSVSVSKSSVYRILKHMKITYKKRSNCRRHKSIDLTHLFMRNDDSYDGDAIAFDESGFYWNDFPNKGWGKRGERVPKHKAGPNNHVSLLLAVGKEGVVHRAVLEGGVGGAEVAKFFEGLPDGRPVILDHPNIHRGQALKALCKHKRIELRYTPHYSPWYNPVEFCFSEIKAAYRPMRLLRRRNHVPDIIACVDKLKGASNCFEHAKREWLADKAARAPA